MFTWLQNMMQKHHKWLFSILLVVIIVAFVFTIGNTGGVGSAARGDFRMDFYGFNLNSQQDMAALSTWTAVSLELQGQRAGGEEMEAAMLQRAVLLSLADELGVPAPDERKLARFVSRLKAFQDPQTGRFSPTLYTDYLDRSASDVRRGEETVTLVILQDYRIEQVLHNLQGPGYTLAGQAKLDLQGRNTKWTVQLATLSREAFNIEVDPDEATLEAYFRDNDFRYEIPPAIEIGYVTFAADDFVDQVGEPDDAQLMRHYDAHRQRWPRREDADAPEPKLLAEIKDIVTASWQEERARNKAVEAANHFAVDAYEAQYSGNLSKDADSIRAFLESHGMSLSTVPPFTRDNPPADASLPRNALRQAANLSQRRFFSDGILVPDGAVVLFFKAEQPAYIPPFEDVRDQVELDYRRAEQRRLYSEQAAKLRADLETAVADGTPFREAAEAAGLSVREPAPFSFANMPRDLDYFVLSALQDMRAGEVSDLIQGQNRDTFVFLAAKEIPAYTSDSEEIQESLKQLRTFSARATGQTLVNELIMIGQRGLERREF